MIHIAHIFMGKQLEKAASSFFDYIHRIGNKDLVKDYFRSFVWLNEDGKWKAKELICNYDDERGNSIYKHKFEYKEQDVSDPASIKALFNDLYSNFMTIETTRNTSEFKLLMYIPLYDKGLEDETKRIVEQLSTLNRNITIDFIGISSDFACLIEDNYDSRTFEENQANGREIANKIIDYKGNVKNRFVILQNRRSDGIAQGLNYNTFITTLGEYALALTECYNELYPAQVEPGDVTGVGMSVLSLDKIYFVTYLMRRAFVKVLDLEKITQEKVDITQIQPIVDKCLRDEYDIYTTFYDKEIEPLVKQGKGHNEIITIISPKLDAHFEELKNKFQSYMETPHLSMPEKQACLAMLLGYDDAIFEGYLFNKEYLFFDDCYKTPVQLFVENNNKALIENRDKNGKVKSVTSIIDKPLTKDGHAYFPLDEVKKLRLEISQSSQDIRGWEKQLEDTNKLIDISEESEKRYTKDGFKYKNVIEKLDKHIKEVQLEETYIPQTIASTAVDLRENFTKIKNQGELGSCTIFALSSLYEYNLKRIKQKDYDLSERYVYYYSNVLTNAIDGGASYKEVLDILAEKGICEEEFCPYSIENISVAPDDRAVEEALKHKILEAKNIEINHETLRATLTEGYPVAISLKISDSFGSKYKGFIDCPTLEELQTSQLTNHAMILCGYSDENKVYIVRNSWGEDFGDRGYCYIPYSYIENPDLNNFCCIITKIQEGDVAVEKTQTVVRFDMADNQIKQFLLKILISEERLKFEKKTKDYKSLQSDNQQLIYSLGSQSKRNAISEAVTKKMETTIENEEDSYKKAVAEMPKKLDEFKKIKWQNLLFGSLITILILLLCFFSWYNDWINTFKVIFTAGSILCACLIVCYFWYKHHYFIIYKQELEDELKEKKSQIELLKLECKTKYLKLYFAGMVIDKVSDLKNSLEEKYNITKAYIGNLKIWRNEVADELVIMDSDTQMPFMNVLKNNKLDEYFENNAEAFLKDIRFSEYLKGFDLNDNTMIAYKERLQQIVIDHLFDTIKDFNMYAYLSKAVTYPYLNGESNTLDNLLKTMGERSDVFLQTTILNPANTFMNKTIFANVPINEQQNWERTYRGQFQNVPISVGIKSSYKLVVFTTTELERNAVTILNE